MRRWLEWVSRMGHPINASDLLDELERLLREERAAVAALDLDKLEPIAARKEQICLELAAVAIPKGCAGAILRVRVLAEANAELIASSAEAVADLIAPPPAPAVYDARARVRRAAHSGMRVTRI